MSKKSIPYWVKQNGGGWGRIFEKMVEVAQVHTTTGDHPDVVCEGKTTLELITEIYIEYAKKVGAADGLYCTWRNVAEKMAKSLKLQPGDKVLIPGLGLGALYQAVETVQPEAEVFGVECQRWLVQIAEAVQMPVVHGDFLDGVSIPFNFDKVLCNPPMGKLWGHNKVECEFLEKIADRTVAGDQVAILLPGDSDSFWGKLLKKHEWLRSTFGIKEEELLTNAAAPKSITVTRYLLEKQ